MAAVGLQAREPCRSCQVALDCGLHSSAALQVPSVHGPLGCADCSGSRKGGLEPVGLPTVYGGLNLILGLSAFPLTCLCSSTNRSRAFASNLRTVDARRRRSSQPRSRGAARSVRMSLRVWAEHRSSGKGKVPRDRRVNAGRKLTPLRRLKIVPPASGGGHAPSSLGTTLPRSRSLSR
jgi:hypothetical protein